MASSEQLWEPPPGHTCLPPSSAMSPSLTPWDSTSSPWPPELTCVYLLGLSMAAVSSLACLCLDSVPMTTACPSVLHPLRGICISFQETLASVLWGLFLRWSGRCQWSDNQDLRYRLLLQLCLGPSEYDMQLWHAG